MPPRLAGGERETLLALLQYQRESLVRKAVGVDEAAAATSPVASGTTLAWLVAHLCRAESSWIEQRFAGIARHRLELPEDRAPTVAEAVAAYRDGWARVDAILATAELDEPCRADTATPPVNLRWVLAHLLEETARHAGHADILRELLDGQTGR
jgi:uncharacterized damage-inducible protein DinB